MDNTPWLREGVAAEVRAELARRKISARTMADAIGVHQRTVHRLLSGQHGISLDELQDIAAYLALDPVELIERTQPPTPTQVPA